MRLSPMQPSKRARNRFLASRVRAFQPIQRNRAVQARNEPFVPEGQYGYHRQFSPQEIPRDIARYPGMGMDAYPETSPQHRETDTNLGDFSAAQLAAGVTVLALRIGPELAADRFKLWWQFSIPEQVDTFQTSLMINGVPLAQTFFEKQPNWPIELFRKFDTQSFFQFRVQTRPGVVPVPPLGRICTTVEIPAYVATYR